MFVVSMWNPVIGQWIDGAREKAVNANVNSDAPEFIAGQTVLANLSLFPMLLIVAFGLFLHAKTYQCIDCESVNNKGSFYE